MSNPTLLGLAAGLVLASSGSAAVINVGPGGSIQTAINGASDGDEIVVAPGTYNEGLNFFGKAIWLHSSDGPEVTTIDGGGGTVVAFANQEGPDSILDGFTVTGGGAGNGGGMKIDQSDPTVMNCVFVGNTTTDNGGGIFIINPANLTLLNCLFTDNDAVINGGALFIGPTASAIIVGCTFVNNSAVQGGAILAGGSATIIDCTFDNNVVTSSGGAIRNSGGDVTMINCRFMDNAAGTLGGAFFASGSARFMNCVFTGNAAGHVGGALFVNPLSNTTQITNCTFVGNSAVIGGGGILNSEFAITTITNSILWLNTPDQILNDDLALVIAKYSNIQGGWPGTGNIDADPLFAVPPDGALRLSPGSPCIDAGINWGVPADTSDLDGDGDTTELMPLDLEGAPRFSDDAGTTDTSCGATAIVDMGAYEFPGKALDCLRPGDVNGDGTVNVLELIELLLAFGASCEFECCLADFDLSGGVDVLDLIQLLLQFGTSCS